MDTLEKIIEYYVQGQIKQQQKEIGLDIIQFLNELYGSLTWNANTARYEMTYTNYNYLCQSIELLKGRLGDK